MKLFTAGLEDELNGSKRDINKLITQVCNENTDFGTISWSKQTLASFNQLNQVLSFTLDTDYDSTTPITPVVCWPYNNNTGRSRYKLTSTINAELPFGEPNHTATIETCLINLIPPTS